jgi:hypothetical protein
VFGRVQHPLVAAYDRKEKSVGFFAPYRNDRNSSGWTLVHQNLRRNHAN